MEINSCFFVNGGGLRLFKPVKTTPYPRQRGTVCRIKKFLDWIDIYNLYQIILSRSVSTAGGGIKGGGF